MQRTKRFAVFIHLLRRSRCLRQLHIVQALFQRVRLWARGSQTLKILDANRMTMLESSAVRRT